MIKLSESPGQATILFDCGSRKVAWLVSQLSVILDLVCCYVHRQEWISLPIHATLQADGGPAAAEVLRNVVVYSHKLDKRCEGGSDYTVHYIVKDIYCAMIKRRQLQELPSGARTLPWKHLKGWDLLELVESPGQSIRRQITVHTTRSKFVA